MLEIPLHLMPRYVAKDLPNLPPLSMNTFDMAHIINYIEMLKTQMSILQNAQEINLKAHLAMGTSLTKQTTELQVRAEVPTEEETEDPVGEVTPTPTVSQLVTEQAHDTDTDQTHDVVRLLG